jgi:hypothetical protein
MQHLPHTDEVINSWFDFAHGSARLMVRQGSWFGKAHQPPTTNRQPPTANRQPSFINQKISKINNFLSIVFFNH